jgi:CYTH domain-containing protein
MFLGDLFGLVLAEVDFDTDEDMDRFAKPAFALAEVTDDLLFTGGRLCELTFTEVRQHISERGLLRKQG